MLARITSRGDPGGEETVYSFIEAGKRDMYFYDIYIFFPTFPCISRDCVRFVSFCETKYKNAAPQNVPLGAHAPIVPALLRHCR